MNRRGFGCPRNTRKARKLAFEAKAFFVVVFAHGTPGSAQNIQDQNAPKSAASAAPVASVAPAPVFPETVPQLGSDSRNSHLIQESSL